MPLPSSRSRWGIALAVGLLGAVGLVVWRQLQAQPRQVALIPPLPQDPLIRVYFNQSQAAAYDEPYRDRHRPGDDLEQVILDAIASAQLSVDMAIQELTLPRIAKALAEKYQAGVPVRVIVENTYNRTWSTQTPDQVRQLDERDRQKYADFLLLADRNQDGQVPPSEAAQVDALALLHQAGVPILDDTADGSKGSDLMHHKFVVIDGRTVVTGSANFTLSGTHGDYGSTTSLGNVNHLVQIEDGAIAQQFSEEFSLMWGDGPGKTADSLFGLQKPYRPPQTVTLPTATQVTVQFSPTSASRQTWEDSANGLISKTLSSATQSIDLSLFVFSDQTISTRLQALHQRGVPIRALIDPGFAYRNYSEALDLLGVQLGDRQCRYGDQNNPWTTPLTSVGSPQLPDGDVLHHKFAVVDDRIVITGSQNWSEAANHQNDEVVLVIENETIAAHFRREFERLYGNATLGIPPWLQEKIQAQRNQCD
ncbi:MAG: phospholipase D-like domain-containing protein [Synechococcales bacterium]|nr:phospholipase D-like domain-containing protein [Synechococcales bacterium]